MFQLALKALCFCLALDFLAGPLQAERAKKPKRRPNPAMQPIEDVAGLPRVLLIGDSISIGYTLPTRKLLQGKANLHRIPANGGPTTSGLRYLKKWLGQGKWDVIHFNWGLHDLKYMDAKRRLSNPKDGKQQVPIKDYEANLQKLVTQLEQTGAKLIWASTTPVPEGAKGRIKGDEIKYNAAAEKVMQEHGIVIDDLYSLALPQLRKIQRPANVHFTAKGSAALAAQVASTIEEALKQ